MNLFIESFNPFNIHKPNNKMPFNSRNATEELKRKPSDPEILKFKSC